MGNIRKVIEKQKSFYQSIVSIDCPILGDTVYFRSDGFHHLISKTTRKRREVNEQYLKLMMIEHAPEIVRDCTKILEIRTEKRKIKGKVKQVTTYELIDGKKRTNNIAVIVQKIGSSGKLKFRSIIRISNKEYNSKKAPEGA